MCTLELRRALLGTFRDLFLMHQRLSELKPFHRNGRSHGISPMSLLGPLQFDYAVNGVESSLKILMSLSVQAAKLQNLS
eukprot:4850184-Amphidinium_carterae.1